MVYIYWDKTAFSQVYKSIIFVFGQKDQFCCQRFKNYNDNRFKSDTSLLSNPIINKGKYRQAQLQEIAHFIKVKTILKVCRAFSQSPLSIIFTKIYAQKTNPSKNYNSFQYANTAGYQYQPFSQMAMNINNINRPLISTQNNSSNSSISPRSFYNEFKPLRITDQTLSPGSTIIRQQHVLIEDYEDDNGEFSKVCKYQETTYDIDVDDDKHIHKRCGWCRFDIIYFIQGIVGQSLIGPIILQLLYLQRQTMLALRALLSNGKCFFSKGKVNIESLKNIDYNTKRKEVINAFNQRMLVQKNNYLRELALYQQQLASAKTQGEEDRIENSRVQYLNKYEKQMSHDSQVFRQQLYKVQSQERTNTVKLYLAQNLPETQTKQRQPDNSMNSSKMYIPNGLIIKKLYHGSKQEIKNLPTNKQILLIGVEKEEEHSLYIGKLIEQFDIKNVVTMVAPDLPYFIKTEKSFVEEWRKFLSNTDFAKKCKFYVNPKPKTLIDICLHKHHIPLVRSSLSRSRAFLQNYSCMMQENELTKKYQPAPLLTGLFPQCVQRMYFAGYPAFQQRRMIADSIPLQKMRQLFNEHLRNFRLGKYNFSAQWLFPKEVLNKKLNHTIGIIRAITDSVQGRCMVICPAEMAQLLSIEWQIGKKSQISYNYQDNNYYLNLSNLLQNEGQQTFIEFIEKLVILDLIIEPIFTKYFVQQRSFPFLCEHTLGGKENVGKIFAVWMHFYKMYYQTLAEKRLESSENQQKRKEQMDQLTHPTDFT